MVLTDLLCPSGKSTENATCEHPLPGGERTHPASALWSKEDHSTTYVTRYLEEGRRGSRDRCGKINARAMERGIQQKRQAGLEKKSSWTMRGNTDFCLEQELTYRTQQRIVRRAALDSYRFDDSPCITGACGRGLRSERCGSRRGLSRHFPGVLHGKGKLHKEGEHTEQRPSAI